jgi:hypothetical protein
VLPPLGLPLMGAALARLRYVSGTATAAFVAALSVGLAATFGVVDLLLVLVGVLLALTLARQMTSVSPGLAVLEATLVICAALFGAQALGAWLSGTTVLAQARAAAEASATLALPLVSDALGDAGVDLGTLTEFFYRIWPADYALNAIISAVPLILSIGWAGRVSGVAVRRLPSLAKTDLDARVLALPVLAVGLLISGRVASGGGLLVSAGINVLLISRPLFVWQGLGVFADRLDRVGVRRAGRTVGYVMALIGEMLFFALSLVGLLDMRFNLRRLPRGDDRMDLSPGDAESGT